MSERRLALLAAINVGKRRMTMDALREAVMAGGFEDVATHLASGNVIYTSDDDPGADEDRLEQVLADAFGFDVPTFVRSLADLSQLSDTADDLAVQHSLSRDGKWYLGFLKRAPTAEALAALETPEDRLFILDDLLFWHRIGSFQATTITTRKLERALGGPVTIRGLPTFQKIYAKFGGG